MTEKCLALVLGGGGARGALQVGALRALLEAGVRPDLMVGTSAGAINATYLAVRGIGLAAVEELAQSWRDAADADLLPSNYLWLAVRALFYRDHDASYHRMREFFVAHGLKPGVRFADIRGARLAIVAADLNAGRPVLYGGDPQQPVLDALLASTALPPWIRPFQRDGRYLMDGGAVSNLPIEAALSLGATEVIALDISDPRSVAGADGFAPFLAKLIIMVQRRQTELEMALAAARGVPVRYVALQAETPALLWDFGRADELIGRGYEIARGELSRWQARQTPAWRTWLSWLRRRLSEIGQGGR